MTPERWKQIDQLFAEVLEESPARREALIRQACIGDEELRREVESLLAAHEQSGSAIKAPGLNRAAELLLTVHTQKMLARPTEEATPHGHATQEPLAPALERGAALRRYVILEHLGGGGMGVVYTAYDPELDRRVAIKLLRSGTSSQMDASEGRTRLLREAQALARLSHPNVIAVFDVGTFEDRVFIAMEYVDGWTLTQWLSGQDRPWREILTVFLQAGRGLAAAHDAGLVHRDFKPDNVLIGRDGRARVLDFGLARAAQASQEDGLEPPRASASPAEPTVDVGPSSKDSPLNARLTRPGFLLGTPAYMAPEQLTGRPTDQRTDQFSFCTALYEALYRMLPFGDGVHPLPGRAEIQDPPKLSRVPSWLRQVVLRGLRLDPDQRYPSMHALLHRLERDPARRSRRAMAAAIGGLVLSAAVLTYRYTKHQQDQLCQGAEQRLTGIWDEDRRGAVSAAFLATGKPYAKDALSGIEPMLNGYAAAWVSMQVDACKATRIRGEQSEELLDLRIHCLAQRLAELKGVTELLAKADEKTVTQAVSTAQDLTSLDGCADTEALKAQVRPPSDRGIRSKVDELRQRLASAKALLDAGKYAEGVERVTPMVGEAKALHYRPIEAEALFLLGSLRSRAGDSKGGEQVVKEAVLAAEAGGHQELIAEGTSFLVYLSYQQANYEQSLEWGQRAWAAIERLGGNERLLASLLPNLGTVLQRLNRFEEAFANHRRALEITERLYGKDDPAVGRLLGLLGTAFGDHHEYAKAVEYYRRSLAVLEKALGPWHPNVGTGFNNLGFDLLLLGKREEAFSAFNRALEIRERALGAAHPDVATTLANIGDLLAEEGKWTQALAHYNRALPIYEKSLGPEHPRLGWILTGIGTADLALDRPEKAIAPLRRAVTLRNGQPGDATDLAYSQYALARALRKTGKDPVEARILAQKARLAFEAGGEEFLSTLEEVDAWLKAK